jgi:hypothetical protein
MRQLAVPHGMECKSPAVQSTLMFLSRVVLPIMTETDVLTFHSACVASFSVMLVSALVGAIGIETWIL